MWAFVVVAFFVAAASADVGEIPGYKYGPGISGKVVTTIQGESSNIKPVTTLITGGSGLLGGSKTIVSTNKVIKNVGNTLITPGIIGGSKTIVSTGPVIQNLGSTLISPVNTGIIGGSKTILSSGGGNIIAPGKTTVIGIDAVDSIPQTVEYNKQVFYFEAPEEPHNEGHITQQLSNILKKNLQVVFIKAPENNAATNAALQLAKQAIEQRTAIYLLSKANDASQIVGKIQQIQESIPTTPEVRIIKYRTQDDLNNAKTTIQAQYDNFGGPSPLINGGIIPVLDYASGGKTVNVIGSGLGVGGLGLGGLGVGIGGGLAGSLGGSVTKVVSGPGYLPPLLRK